ncbi:MAG: nitrate reductase [Moraxellaceae bacterium]|jgi:nitrate reductase delta subunit|nr:nitrate reductase [Moraxellaceae bacterium]
MKILKVISLLLDYPVEALQGARGELAAAIAGAREISPAQRQALQAVLDRVAGGELLDAQEGYTELFERGRFLSLLLFEHVHGESRDRGQAMVDLMAQYEAAGFAIGVRELPDYIPLYLEYLSTCDAQTAREGLADVSHLLALLAARLEERGSDYSACLRALLQVAGAEPAVAMAEVQAQVAQEVRDDTLAALDAEWEEEAVNFMAGEADSSACSGAATRPSKAREDVAVPVHWVDFKQTAVPAGNP